MQIAVLQMTSGIEPDGNARTILDAAREAAESKAAMLFTPEMAGLLDRNRSRAAHSIAGEADDKVLAAVREAAQRFDLWIALGSLAIKKPDGSWANRSLLVNSNGEICARYDKMHMFDVDLASGESWRESSAYCAGDEVVAVGDTPVGRLGLSICYDLRFPALYDVLGRQSCDVLAIPAAFTIPTGSAHWHVLQRARAIEASAYVVASAQVGEHEDGRRTYGHSLVIDPWGEVLLDMGGEKPGIGFAEIDLARIAEVRAQVPSLANRREIASLNGI